MNNRVLTCVEICAGAGGQALGLAEAGFFHVALVEYEQEYCNILRINRQNKNKYGDNNPTDEITFEIKQNYKQKNVYSFFIKIMKNK